MPISPARTAAFDILLRIEKEKAFSSVLLPLYENQLSEKDRALCHEITLGVLRRQIYLDKIIDILSGAKKLDIEVRIALRIGIFQLLYLNKIPAHSAINESVELVAKARKSSAKGFVNAILRRASEGIPGLTFLEEIEKLSVETSHPQWLIEKWIADFGFEAAENLAKANNEKPRNAFRFPRKLLSEPRALAEDHEKSSFVEGCFFAERIDSRLHNLAERGEIYFQDEASQLVASSINLKNGNKFLDVCAAPGSKTTMIANDKNASLFVAGDLNWSRVKFLKENCRKQEVDFVKIVQYDAEKALPFAENTFDTVLVDAPCTGTGTIRNNPEIRYFISAQDFTELSRKQLAIIVNASKLVCLKGEIIYSTCSLEKEENEQVAEKFLTENPEFKKIEPNVPRQFITADGYARTFPHRDRMDGFFIAAFKRK